MARLTLPGVPSPSARSPRGLPPPALGSASAAAVGDTAGQTQRSLPPRPQHRLRPPGASARAEPDGHPGTGGRRASRTSLEPGEQRSPPPWGTLGSPETQWCVGVARGGVPTPGSPALRGRCARRSAPFEVPELAGTPPRAPRWYGPPPFKGSALGRRYLRLGRVEARAAETPALGLGPRGPETVGMCREWEHPITALSALAAAAGLAIGNIGDPQATLLQLCFQF